MTLKSFRVGVVSDTHGLMRPEAFAFLQGSDHIIHAGDIGNADIIAQLQRIAPVTAVRGNNDKGGWAEALPETELFEISGCWFYLIHDLNDMDIDPLAAGVGVVISGHTHHPKATERDGVLYLNPGSAGPRRFSLPVSIAELLLPERFARCVTLT